MAETGLLVDRMNGEPHSALIPWFDPAATPQAQLLGQAADPVERFCRTGIRPNFKCSLAKILWLRERDPNLLDGAVWLNAADYLAYRLAGTMATDYSLAGRTYAYDIGRKEWDRDWLSALGIAPGLFPRPCASGEPVGSVQRRPAAETGLVEGTPVAICGHDHICAAFAAGAIEPGMVFDSMGTAEALVGAFSERGLTEADYRSGLVYGCHVARGNQYYWMGGLSASGGSVEWLRGILGDPALSYDQLQTLLEGASAGPTGILYFPYLSGSGSPHTDLHVRAAFIGLQADHDQAELVKAVLEGTAYEVEFIRRRAEEVFGIEIRKLVASGGGTRNPGWMQIKADVSGCAVQVTKTAEATLLGAALVAGVGIGIYADEGAALAKSTRPEIKTYYPDEHRHSMYLELYDDGYLALQRPLREK
jgi:xylulokinase